MSNLIFMTPKDISIEYNLPISVVREILNATKNPCPLVKGRNGKRFIVEKSVFENWIKTKSFLSVSEDKTINTDYTKCNSRSFK